MLARFHAASPLTRIVPTQGAAVALTKDGRLVHLVPADYVPWTQPVAQAVGVAVQRAKEDFASARPEVWITGDASDAHEQGAGRARLEDRGAEAGAGERPREIRRQIMRRSLFLVPVSAGRGLRWGERPRTLRAARHALEARQPAHAAGLVSTVDPNRYTLEFQEAFRVRAQADCNVCTGSYRTATSIQITIGPLSCTRAFCGSDSRGDEYAALLNTTELYALEGDTLILVLQRRHPALPAVEVSRPYGR